MSTYVSEEQAYAYAELLEVFEFLDESDIQKIPQKLMNIIKSNALSSYTRHLDYNLPLEDQNISRKTTAILTVFTINYWCESEAEKKELLKTLNDNKKENERRLREKYNPDNMFNNNQSTYTTHQSKSNPIDNKSSQTFNSNVHHTYMSNESNTLQNDFNHNSNLPLDFESLSLIKKIQIKIISFIKNIFNKK